MGNEFTPGPWAVAPGNFIVADCFRGEPSSGKIVAEVPCQGANPHDLNLIAAAPAMYEALRKLLTGMPWFADESVGPESDAGVSSKAISITVGDVRRARAALALANGQDTSKQ